MDGGDDLLGEYEFDGVANDRDWITAEEPGDGNRSWFGPEGVAVVDVDVESDLCSRQWR